MKVKTVKYQVYKFSELSREAKDKVIAGYYEREDYPFFKEELTESCKALLEQYKVKFEDLQLHYSLSYCQGDGLCFVGNFEYKRKKYNITHNYRYYFATSVEISEVKDDEEIYLPFKFQDNKDNPFIKVYLKICRELEKEGYGILEYRMEDKEFAELADDNGWEYLKDGTLFVTK